MTKDTFKSLLAAGNTRQVIESLLPHTQGDRDLHAEAVALSARYQHYLREKNGGRAERVWLDTELNKINAAALALIEADADTSNAPVTSEKTVQTPAQNTSTIGNDNQKTADLIDRSPEGAVVVKKMNWEKVALLWLGIFAAIAGITGYTLRDYFKKPEPIPIVQPQVELPAQNRTELPKSQPSTTQPAAKNQTNIHMKDKSKVGIINTGDSAVFKDIKQDF